MKVLAIGGAVFAGLGVLGGLIVGLLAGKMYQAQYRLGIGLNRNVDEQ